MAQSKLQATCPEFGYLSKEGFVLGARKKASWTQYSSVQNHDSNVETSRPEHSLSEFQLPPSEYLSYEGVPIGGKKRTKGSVWSTTKHQTLSNTKPRPAIVKKVLENGMEGLQNEYFPHIISDITSESCFRLGRGISPTISHLENCWSEKSLDSHIHHRRRNDITSRDMLRLGYGRHDPMNETRFSETWWISQKVSEYAEKQRRAKAIAALLQDAKKVDEATQSCLASSEGDNSSQLLSFTDFSSSSTAYKMQSRSNKAIKMPNESRSLAFPQYKSLTLSLASIKEPTKHCSIAMKQAPLVFSHTSATLQPEDHAHQSRVAESSRVQSVHGHGYRRTDVTSRNGYRARFGISDKTPQNSDEHQAVALQATGTIQDVGLFSRPSSCLPVQKSRPPLSIPKDLSLPSEA